MLDFLVTVNMAYGTCYMYDYDYDLSTRIPFLYTVNYFSFIKQFNNPS